jgi:membrane-associated phospholipid phosphatase
MDGVGSRSTETCRSLPGSRDARRTTVGSMPSPRLAAALFAVLALRLATPAAADDAIAGHAIDRPTDGLLIGGALALGFGLSLSPMRADHALWQHELFGEADGAVHGNFSPRAAQISDATLAATIAAPIVYLTGSTIEDADGDRLLLYGESLAVNFAVFEGAKHLVQRPRPYLYSSSPEVVRYANRQGGDAYQSFYSAHAATAFCAATAGAYLAGASSSKTSARAVAWGGGFAAAAAAANLRVRAGKHFYSDIVIGSAIGIAIGYAVPALHADGRPYVPDLTDLGAAAAGLFGGGLLSELLPLEHRRDDSLGTSPHVVAKRSRLPRALRTLHAGPVPVPSGTGVGIAGAL